jgi:hypothetical protein
MQPFESVAVTTIGNAPVWAGEPWRRPVVASKIKLSGSVLTVEKVVVPIPPVCVKVWLKEDETVPVVVGGFVTTMVWQPIASG